MGFISIFSIAVGLSMDAFAVALCKGISLRKTRGRDILTVALYFGIAQGIMPILGYLLANSFSSYIIAIDHWIALILLSLIGGKMIKEGFSGIDDCDVPQERLSHREMFTLAVATSIDAAAIGITFAFLNVEIISAGILIATTTFIISAIGVAAGKRFGKILGGKAEILGGITLIIIGVSIFLEHTVL